MKKSSITFLFDSSSRVFYLSPHLYEKLDDCDNENKQKPFDCVNNFIAEKAGCMPHTYGLNASKVFQRCVTIEEYRTFFNTAYEVFRGKHFETLQTQRCTVRNCNRYTWSGRRTWDAELSQIHIKPSHEVSPLSKLETFRRQIIFAF